MSKHLAFKVTVEYICHDMVDEETLQTQYGGDPLEAYRYISDDFTDSPASFSNSERVVKVEITNQPERA